MYKEKDKDCLAPENNSKYCFLKVANAFLLLANVLLIILGFYYLPSKSDNTYFSVIIAVLGVLVTVLITWQIWQTIESRHSIEKFKRSVRDSLSSMDDKLNSMDNRIKQIEEHLNSSENNARAAHELSIGYQKYREGFYDDAIKAFAAGLEIQYATSAPRYVRKFMGALFQFKNDNVNIQFSKETKLMVIRSLSLYKTKKADALLNYFVAIEPQYTPAPQQDDLDDNSDAT